MPINKEYFDFNTSIPHHLTVSGWSQNQNDAETGKYQHISCSQRIVFLNYTWPDLVTLSAHQTYSGSTIF